jgi:hypothetical protein
LAVERLEAALAGIDETSVSLAAQEPVRKSKNAMSTDAHDALRQMQSNGRLTDLHVNSLLAATSLVAMQLAQLVGREEDVDQEVRSFRRASQQLYAVWDTTLPQIEALADAARKQQDAAAHASRVAAELLGSHTALANGFANALENLKRGK